MKKAIEKHKKAWASCKTGGDGNRLGLGKLREELERHGQKNNLSKATYDALGWAKSAEDVRSKFDDLGPPPEAQWSKGETPTSGPSVPSGGGWIAPEGDDGKAEINLARRVIQSVGGNLSRDGYLEADKKNPGTINFSEGNVWIWNGSTWEATHKEVLLGSYQKGVMSRLVVQSWQHPLCAKKVLESLVTLTWREDEIWKHQQGKEYRLNLANCSIVLPLKPGERITPETASRKLIIEEHQSKNMARYRTEANYNKDADRPVEWLAHLKRCLQPKTGTEAETAIYIRRLGAMMGYSMIAGRKFAQVALLLKRPNHDRQKRGY